jgi:uncharacterized protein YaaN involved in tellurite resistance
MTEEKNQVLEDLLASSFDVEKEQSFTNEQKKELQAIKKSMITKTAYEQLSLENQEAAKKLAKTMDTSDFQSVIYFGAKAQEKLTEFSQSVLNKVTMQDIAPIGDSLNQLMFHLNEAKPSELSGGNPNFFKKMFGKVRQSIYEVTAKYQKIGANIEKVALKLENEKNGLLKDNQMLDELYKQNLDYFQALNVYIAAAELKLEELNQKTIPEAVQKADSSDDQMNSQIVNDLHQYVDRLEKRAYDLKLARQITLQQAPQIRLIQNTNQALAEKIQASIHTAIPLWKNQVVIALTLLKQKDAVMAQRQVSETTNALLAKNSELLKISAIETARENERGIVELETLQKTQNSLMETIEETLKIQQVGREKRRLAEVELQNMEEGLKAKLLKLNQG